MSEFDKLNNIRSSRDCTSLSSPEQRRTSGAPAVVILFCAAVVLAVSIPYASTAELPAVENRFQEFSRSWMARLDSISQKNRRVMKLEKGLAKKFVGRYVCYGPQCRIEVKKTDSDKTPYVGIIYYPQKVIRLSGDTRQEVLDDKGTVVEETRVTEIFPYMDGRWKY